MTGREHTGEALGSARARGTTLVLDRAVRRIAQQAAKETAAPLLTTPRVAVARGRGADLRLALTLEIACDGDLATSGRLVRAHTLRRTRALAGVPITDAVVTLGALGPPVQVPSERVPLASDGGHRAPRPWSARSFPAVLFAGSGLVLLAALLFARWSHRRLPAVPEALRPGETGHLVLAAVGCAWGLCLLFLAAAPGLRGRVPWASPAQRMQITVDRRLLSDSLRDAALAVDGVQDVRSRLTRSTARLRVTAGHGELSRVQLGTEQAVDQALASMSLAWSPRVRVRVRAAGRLGNPPKGGAGS
ncbi:DUF6286 domain-containing protein [Streptomyces sp. NPDC006879]|uniref:DUF6286 domain-containing protein n=1 Tax=Streptomyces sp. NPDC006879 TaxID=3364767 RepID=UPI003679D7E8